MIRAEGLSKAFGTVQAVRDVGLTAADGRITALLGPNGAGKSTTLRILATVLRADRGEAWVDGHAVGADPGAVRRAIGVLPHGAGLYERLTARENVAYFGALHGLGRQALRRRVDALLEQLDMGEFADRRVGGVSKVALHTGAEYQRLAGGRVDQRGDDADQRRLAGAVGTEQREEIALLDVQRDALQRLDAVLVDFAEVLDFQRVHRSRLVQSGAGFLS